MPSPADLFSEHIETALSTLSPTAISNIHNAKPTRFSNPEHHLRHNLKKVDAVILDITELSFIDTHRDLAEQLLGSIDGFVPRGRHEGEIVLTEQSERERKLSAFCRALQGVTARAITDWPAGLPSREALREAFLAAERVWRSDYIEFDVLAPLANCILTSFDVVPLGDSAFLKQARSLEKFLLNEHGDPRHTLHHGESIILSHRFECLKHDTRSRVVGDVAERMADWVTALRLATGWEMGMRYLVAVPSYPYVGVQPCESWRWDTPTTAIHQWHPGDTNRLTSQHTDEAIRIDTKRSVNAAKSLRLATERYNLALSRWSPVDSIIDCAIAIESALGRSSNDTPKSLRVSLRAGMLLRDTLGFKEATSRIHRLAKVRNDVVHGSASGGRQSVKNEAWDEIIKTSETSKDLLKQITLALLDRLNDNNSLTDVLRDLDWEHDKLLDGAPNSLPQ